MNTTRRWSPARARFQRISSLLGLALALARGPLQAAIRLDRWTVVADPDPPAFVQYAMQELTNYLNDVTGGPSPAAGKPVVKLAIGSRAARSVLGDAFANQELGPEGYLLQTLRQGDTPWIVAAGQDTRGTKNALAALIKAIQVDGNTASFPEPFERRGRPKYGKRGMHLNGWPLNYPYSFRNWREEDWRNYLDFLSLQGVNLFYLWPFLEIMPVPFSAEEEAYLRECRRVVDYAQRKHGMEVWIMHCANRVAKDRCGVADPRLRPYWRPSQEDLDPDKPADFQAILESREALYRRLDNADGVGVIDSDPGFCPTSNLDAYVKVLQACRGLLDRLNEHGKEAKLVNWMLWGWGRKEKISRDGLPEHQRLALRALKQGLPDSLWLISGQFPEYLPLCREAGFLERTVLLPYGAIEFEPAYPHTTVQVDSIRDLFQGPDPRTPGLAGFMGNVQTPLLQLPNTFFLTSVLMDSEYAQRSEAEVLSDLAGYLYPKQRQLLVDGYRALKETDAGRVERAADRLEQAAREGALGRPGLYARKLFPQPDVAVASLLLQLRLRAAQERLLADETLQGAPSERERRLAEYFQAYLAWDTAHGWHQLWEWSRDPLGGLPSDGRYRTLTVAMGKSLGTPAAVAACCERIALHVPLSFDLEAFRQGCLAPLKQALLATLPGEPAK